jgi:hypothetical protein
MMCNALLAARSPPRFEPMADGLSRGGRNWADAAQRCEAGLRPQSFRVVAGRKEKLGGSDVPDRIAGDEVRRQLIDDGGDHHIEIRDLIMQFEVTAGQGLKADAIGGFHVAISSKIGPLRGQGADELHAGDAPQLIEKAVGSADDRVVDHLQSDAPGAHRGLLASHDNP